jgi:hypothetical protein
MMKKFTFIFSWLPLGIAVTLLSFLVYGVAQQMIRLGANTLPLQMAEDAAADLERGITPQAVIPKYNVNIETSLAPFMIVYDDKGEIISTNAVLGAKVPGLPTGVLNYTREHKENRITWQPKAGVRAATVVIRNTGDKPGFVIAGQSLREAEKLVDKLGFDVLIGWVGTMAATIFVTYAIHRSSFHST